MNDTVFPDSARALAFTNALRAFAISDVDCARLLKVDLLTVQSMINGTVAMSPSVWSSVFCLLSFEWRKRLEEQGVDCG